jgi:hypothetical protein
MMMMMMMIATAMGKCKFLSKSWHGRCIDTSKCNKHCREEEEEGAYGGCIGYLHSKCYCTKDRT